MKRIPAGLMFSALFLGVLSCVNTVQAAEENGHSRASEIPDWYVNPPASGSRLYGVAEVRSEDLGRTKAAAVSKAREDLSRQLSLSLESMLGSYLRETGLRGNRVIADWAAEAVRETSLLELRDAQHRKTYPLQEKNGDFTVFVLLEYERSRALNEDIAGILRRDEENRPESLSTEILLERLKMEMEKNPPRTRNGEN